LRLLTAALLPALAGLLSLLPGIVLATLASLLAALAGLLGLLALAGFLRIGVIHQELLFPTSSDFNGAQSRNVPNIRQLRPAGRAQYVERHCRAASTADLSR
jgi:hypothetical protein